MAVVSTARATACAWPPRLKLLRGILLVALLALNSKADRLDRSVVDADGAMLAALASESSVPSVPDSAGARAQRDSDLRAAARYLESINVERYLRLGDIKDTLELFEHIKERVLSFGAASDFRHLLQIRHILRHVKKRGDALKVLASKFEAEGQVDDGGDELPTQREHICSRISKYRVELAFAELVQLFCQSLDGVREAVAAGQDEEPLAYSVSGLSNAMTNMLDYRQCEVRREIEYVLGEERRWVAKHLAPGPAGSGSGVPLPEGTRTRFRTWDLRAWETHIWEDVEVDAAAVPFKLLKEAHDMLVRATADDDLILSSVRTRMQRIDFSKTKLAQLISVSDSTFREQVREVFQEMKVRMEALRELEAHKLAAGEVDNSGDLLPSQRDNICATLDGYGLDEDFREDVRKICETFDKLHIVGKLDFWKDFRIYELTGRMISVKRRPGYADSPVASELESLFAEEWSWLAHQGEEVGGG